MPTILEALLKSPPHDTADVTIVSRSVTATSVNSVMVTPVTEEVVPCDTVLKDRAVTCALIHVDQINNDEPNIVNNEPLTNAARETPVIAPVQVKRGRGRPPKKLVGSSSRLTGVNHVAVTVASSGVSSSHVASRLRSRLSAGDKAVQSPSFVAAVAQSSSTSNIVDSQSLSVVVSNSDGISVDDHLETSVSCSSRRKQSVTHRANKVKVKQTTEAVTAGQEPMSKENRQFVHTQALILLRNLRCPLKARKQKQPMRRQLPSFITHPTYTECVEPLRDDDCRDITAAPVEAGGKDEEEEEEEEIIRCICNIYRDEGVMIQCDTCQVRHIVLYLFRCEMMIRVRVRSGSGLGLKLEFEFLFSHACVVFNNCIYHACTGMATYGLCGSECGGRALFV